MQKSSNLEKGGGGVFWSSKGPSSSSFWISAQKGRGKEKGWEVQVVASGGRRNSAICVGYKDMLSNIECII